MTLRRMGRQNRHWAALAVLCLAMSMGCGDKSTVNPRLMKCIACNREISKEALSCPHCGQPNLRADKKWQPPSDALEVGKDVVVAAECDIENGQVTLLKFDGMPLSNEGLRHIIGLKQLGVLMINSPKCNR